MLIHKMSQEQRAEFLDLDPAQVGLLLSQSNLHDPLDRAEIDLVDDLGFALHPGHLPDVVVGLSLLYFLMQVGHAHRLSTRVLQVKSIYSRIFSKQSIKAAQYYEFRVLH